MSKASSRTTPPKVMAHSTGSAMLLVEVVSAGARGKNITKGPLDHDARIEVSFTLAPARAERGSGPA
ncbi:hypothetical protein BJF82_14295 [Kytococcus sp. CUA-901]|nr:hypothetical protein BJF82_14295 [Kytococcus sp. CUA-901]